MLPDVAAAVAIGGVLLVGALSGPGGAGPLVYVTVLLGATGVSTCRRFPLSALVPVTASMLGYVALVEATPQAAFGVLGAVYFAARAGLRAAAVAASVLFLAVFLTLDLSATTQAPAREVVQKSALLTGWFVAANVLGVVSRQRRAYLSQVEQRAVEAERTREEVALRRAGEERLRIARELHDSLTHRISIIKLQAGVAVHLARKRGQQEPESLLAIQDASGAAMRELRATLDVLRHGGADTGGEGAGLDQLDELLEQARATGLMAKVTISGQHRVLPAQVERAAYRVVQEALTNVARHAAADSVNVHLGYGDETLTVRVEDDGNAAEADTAPGFGLTGMRERVTALGGSLEAAPRLGGGFRVVAELPLPEQPHRTVLEAR